MADYDARALNWRFVLPDEPAGLLLLPVDREEAESAVLVDATERALDARLAAGPYPAVVAPDVGAWAKLTGRTRATTLVAELAGSVEPGGSLYIGFRNTWFPLGLGSRRSLHHAAVERAIAEAGAVPTATYYLLPDQRCPAYIISSGTRGELDYFLDRLFLPYTGGLTGWRGRLKQRALMLAKRIARAAPSRARVLLAPAMAIVARRPS